jgi:hypothetical protein
MLLDSDRERFDFSIGSGEEQLAICICSMRGLDIA